MRKGSDNSKKNNDIKDVSNLKDKNRQGLKLFIWTIICIFVFYQVFILVQYTLGKKAKSSMWLYNGINKVVSFIIPKYVEVEEKKVLNLVALGDIYTTSNILKAAKSSDGYELDAAYKNTKEVLSKYDITIASLNTPIVNGDTYGAKSIYNAPEDLLDTIKYLGLSVVTTAGNHIYDKGEDGILNTISVLRSKKVDQVGINESSKRSKPYIINKNDIKIALLSYSTESNIDVKNSKEYLVNSLTDDNIKEDMNYIKTQNVDFIIAYLNVPNVDSTMVNSKQKTSTDKLFENGVNIVLGTGSKIVQEKTEDIFTLKDNSKNHVYAIYSLGDFIGDMDSNSRKISVSADITFTKNITKDKKGLVIESKTKRNMIINEPISFYTKVTSTFKITNYPIKTTLDKYYKDNSSLDIKDYDLIKAANDYLSKIIKNR